MTQLESPFGLRDIGQEAKPPYAVLPDPTTLFLGRSRRLRTLAPGHTLEAYLNFAGESTLAFWRSIDRISTESKLEVLCQRAGIVPDFGKRPYQSVKELWVVRNFLAHARVQSATEEWIQDDPIVAEREYPLVDLERKCCKEPATRMVQDVEAVIRELHCSLCLSEGALGFIGHGGGRISAVREDA